MFRKYRNFSAVLAATLLSAGFVVAGQQEVASTKPHIVEGKTLTSGNRVSQKKRRLRARRAGKFN